MSNASGCYHKGHFTKMCAECAAKEPYMEFKLSKGYFWGQGFPDINLRGTQPYWMTHQSTDEKPTT